MAKEASSTTPAVDKPASTTPEPLLNTEQIGELIGLGSIHVERLVHEGLPHLDLGIHSSKPRQRRTLRFIWSDCLSWLQGRNSGQVAK